MEQRHRQRQRRHDADRISCLPDDVLHRILLRVGSVPAAARTSVLSRRWRIVWAHLPELVLSDNGLVRNRSIRNAVDGALAGNLAPTLRVLGISMFNESYRVPSARIARWLRIASQRVAGEIYLCLPWRPESLNQEKGVEEDLELPLCARATAIQLSLGHGFRQLRLPLIGTFSDLRILRIQQAKIDIRNLEKVVSSQCPCLLELQLMGIILLTMSDVSIRSVSLKKLIFDVKNTRRLVVGTPSIEELSLSKLEKVSVASVKLPEVNSHDANNPHGQLPAVAGRHLRRLVVNGSPQVMTVLMRHFTTIDELQLDLLVSPGEGYKSFLRSTMKVARCNVLTLNLTAEWHASAPSVLHLLRKSVGLKKLVVYLPLTESSQCMPGCACGRRGSLRTDIAIDSLEMIEIHDFRGEEHQVELVKLLLSFKNTVLSWLENGKKMPATVL
ncbi:hypothetical protein EJB05_03089, partial [Eragrostis curvula]